MANAHLCAGQGLTPGSPRRQRLCFQVHPRVPARMRRLQPSVALPMRRGLRQAAAGWVL